MFNGNITQIQLSDSLGTKRDMYVGLFYAKAGPFSPRQIMLCGVYYDQVQGGTLYVITQNLLSTGITDGASSAYDATFTFMDTGATGTYTFDFRALTTQDPLTATSTRSANLDFTGVANGEWARRSLDVISNKREDLDLLLSQLGAAQEALGFEAGNASAARENYMDAASRIMDADIADESAQMVRNQILQQTGAAVLAQANQQPAITLKLLGGFG